MPLLKVAFLLLILVASALGVSLALPGCSSHSHDAIGEQTNPLSRNSTDTVWAWNAVIPVCWMQASASGFDQQKDWARQAIENSWMKVTNVQFTEWKTCDPTDGLKVYLKLNLQNYNGGQTEGYGATLPRYAANASEGSNCAPPTSCNRSMDLGLANPPIGDWRSVTEGVVVHEFGHVLGYRHEQDQDAGFGDTYYTPPIWVDGGVYTPCAPGGGYWDAQADVYVWIPGNFNNDLVTTYDPDSIMNYCHQDGREYSGRLSTLDIQGVQASTEYGAPALLDQDGDGKNDRVDNCPYVKNGFQENSNGAAELAVQLANPSGWNTCLSTEDGHVPTGSDPDCYVTHWHLAYAGDACDPAATTATSFETVVSKVETHTCTVSQPCYDKWLPAGSIYPVTDGGTYPVTLSTGLMFDSHLGGPAGMALPNTIGARGAATFCQCPHSTATACANDVNYNCVLADDNAYPYKYGSVDPSGFKQLSIETSWPCPDGGWCANNPGEEISPKHVDPMDGYDPATIHQTWDFLQDLSIFGLSPGSLPPGGPNSLAGVGWTHEHGYPYTIQNRQQWYPWDGGSPADQLTNSILNLSNNYWVNSNFTWDAIKTHFILPLGPVAIPWFRIPYCDPTWDPTWGESIEHGVISYMAASNLGGTFVATGLGGGSVFDLTPRFSANAQGLLNSLTTGNDMLVADDRVGGQPRSATGYNAIVLNANTPRVVGAITDTGSGMNATYATTVVGSGQGTLRSFSATNQALYWLAYSGGWQLNTRLLSNALVGNASVTTVNVSGTNLQSPRSIAYNSATNTVLVIDWVSVTGGNAIRLVNVNITTGVATEVWTTGSGMATSNDGFETGDLTGWTATGASETVESWSAHSGTHAAMLGSTSPTNGDSSISQTFTAPSDATTISFWYRMSCPDTVYYDWATATLTDNGPVGGTTTLLPKTCQTSSSWTHISGAVTPGHNYTLTLTSHDDNYGADPTYTLYDDVALGDVTPTLYVSTTAEGDVVVSASQSSGSGSVDVLLTNAVGRPLGSYTVAGTLQSAVVGHASGITLPLTQTATDSTPNLLLSFVNRSALNYGVCSSTLFKAIANRNTGNLSLADGPSCP